jgi:hypothetical protein
LNEIPASRQPDKENEVHANRPFATAAARSAVPALV